MSELHELLALDLYHKAVIVKSTYDREKDWGAWN